ncbi:hypothetical protein A2716_01725 [candidate division WWE3 bacterium RIFCSPHIGHO2_01_FULL_40_23]|uniref:Uncharacterized protein n=1 Tax=candidate division WWE3 bacterium RIFCSPLOWO2_01_FULL_41_18 TaxID=1802625 RepID=A0A1F4VEM0_UNCKA|nr:MAG: hypothetical protein A2716_01725 [candidate division WWE3 bacterium RIFCSPHIGHO2_01_FULL_40_23]OGC55712.1 MAG: hypothetical protein A3A78_01575 [candidate division WWE3 bacterium RIFCSPLOWO2_01_FULL_41_18]
MPSATSTAHASSPQTCQWGHHTCNNPATHKVVTDKVTYEVCEEHVQALLQTGVRGIREIIYFAAEEDKDVTSEYTLPPG